MHSHIQYFAISYSKCPDHEGHVAIMLDEKEIVLGGYYNNRVKAVQFLYDDKYVRRMSEEMAFMDDTAIQLGVFDQRYY